MEALACRRVIQFAKEIGLQNVFLKGDSALVIQAINEGLLAQFVYGHIIEHVLHIPTAVVVVVVVVVVFFCHVKHNSNKVADALAKKAEDGVELQVWLEALPENIVPLALFKVH